MKPKIFTLVITLYMIICNLHAQTNTFPTTGSAGIGTTTPDASSALEIKSTTKGLLIPRMTKAQRDAIAAPVVGLMIYQTNSIPGFYYFDGSGWNPVSKKAWSLTGNSGTNPSSNFLGTTDQQPLLFKVNNYKSGLIDYNISSANTAFGYQTLDFNTASYNTAIGYQALMSNNSGYSNTATGYQSLLTNTIGYSNVANGTYALFSNLDGNSNVATGYAALYHNISGFNNIASGYASLYSNTNGFSNIALGRYSLFYGTSPIHQIAIGDSALMHFTGAGLSYSGNIAIGSEAMAAATTGDLNVAIGWHALSSNTNANDNVAVGYASMVANNGFANTATGMQSLTGNTTGSDNTAIGFDALYANTSGNRNTTVGEQSLFSNTTGSNNTAIGYGADVSAENLTNTISVGYSTVVNVSNKAVIGNNSVTVIGGHVGWSILSDGRFKTNIKENVPGLEFINKLKPVTYSINETKYAKFIGLKDSLINADKDAFSKAAQKIRTGFIAQEVEKSAREINYDFDGINRPQNDKDNYSLVYADFVPSLVKAVQQLSSKYSDKDSIIASQQSQLTAQQKQIDELRTMLLQLQQNFTNCSLCGQKSVSGLQATTNLQTIKDKPETIRLEQNAPNPFNASTTIKYYLPVNNGNVYINFYNSSGSLLKSVKLNGTGNGSTVLNAHDLLSGSYRYTLVADGKVIDSKQMILAK